MNKMTYPKFVFPHLYEFYRLGSDQTPEGRSYLANHQDICDKEFSVVMDVNRERYRLGGSEYIHNSLKLQVRINSSF